VVGRELDADVGPGARRWRTARPSRARAAGRGRASPVTPDERQAVGAGELGVRSGSGATSSGVSPSSAAASARALSRMRWAKASARRSRAESQLRSACSRGTWTTSTRRGCFFTVGSRSDRRGRDGAQRRWRASGDLPPTRRIEGVGAGGVATRWTGSAIRGTDGPGRGANRAELGSSGSLWCGSAPGWNEVARCSVVRRGERLVAAGLERSAPPRHQVVAKPATQEGSSFAPRRFSRRFACCSSRPSFRRDAVARTFLGSKVSQPDLGTEAT
jgi:hypothetical protein